MSYAPAGTPGQHIIVVEAALSRLRERVQELEAENSRAMKVVAAARRVVQDWRDGEGLNDALLDLQSAVNKATPPSEPVVSQEERKW